MLQRILTNLAATSRIETLEGRKYLVVPMVMITEGVHNGSGGRLYYPDEELRKTPVVWNHKPIVVYHPQVNGQHVSACDPIVLEKSKVGMVMGTTYKKSKKKPTANAKAEPGKLHAEAWLEVSRLEAVDRRVLEAIEADEMMEVSTGLFTDNEQGEGEWNGETFDATARNYRPDHLAILPDQVGACSIADGAGLLRVNTKAAEALVHKFESGGANASQVAARLGSAMRLSVEEVVASFLANERSFSNIQSDLFLKVREKYGDETWVVDVYDSFFVFEEGGKLWRSDYAANDTGSVIDEKRAEVRRVTEYRTTNGDFVGNSRAAETPKQKDAESMKTKKELVDGLIAANSKRWTEEDRKFLETMDEARLGKLLEAEAVAANTTTDEKKVEATPAANAATQTTPAPVKQATFEELLANADPKLRSVINSSLAMHNQAHAELVEKLAANARCPFTKEQLAAKELGELQALAKLAGMDEATKPAPSYFGQAPTPAANTSAPVVNEGLGLPSMDFATAK